MENQTLDKFIEAYSKGKRHFKNCDFNEKLSVKGFDLTDVFFEDCFLFLDFRNATLKNAKFIRCNIKTADFRNSDLTLYLKIVQQNLLCLKGQKQKGLYLKRIIAMEVLLSQMILLKFLKTQIEIN